MSGKVLREKRGQVEVVTLNRPEVRNALDPETVELVTIAFREIADDPEVRVAILTGTGDKAFCAGMDLKAFAQRGGGASPKSTDEPSFTRAFCPKPVIAAVNGTAVAGGFELVLACDLVVAADHAKFGIPEVKRGLIAGGGGLVRLPNRIARTVAMELAFTGDLISGARAYELGLVNKVVPSADLLDEAFALADRICANAPGAVRASKRVIAGAVLDEEHAWDVNAKEFAAVSAGPDALEGARAFAEKRDPVWTDG